MDSLIYPFSCLACSPRMDCCYRPALVARTTLPRLRGCTALQTLIIHEVAGWSILLSWHLGYASAGCKSPYPARCPAERARERPARSPCKTVPHTLMSHRLDM